MKYDFSLCKASRGVSLIDKLIRCTTAALNTIQAYIIAVCRWEVVNQHEQQAAAMWRFLNSDFQHEDVEH